jgi:hypothetical protein
MTPKSGQSRRAMGLFLRAVLFWMAFAIVPISSANAQHVSLCNTGDVELKLASITKEYSGSTFMGAFLEGWTKLPPRNCESLFIVGLKAIAFIQERPNGEIVNPVYESGDAVSSSLSERTLCVKLGEDFEKSGRNSAALERFTKSCEPGFVQVRVSVNVFHSGFGPDNNRLTLNINSRAESYDRVVGRIRGKSGSDKTARAVAGAIPLPSVEKRFSFTVRTDNNFEYSIEVANVPKDIVPAVTIDPRFPRSFDMRIWRVNRGEPTDQLTGMRVSQMASIWPPGDTRTVQMMYSEVPDEPRVLTCEYGGNRSVRHWFALAPLPDAVWLKRLSFIKEAKRSCPINDD